MKLRRILLSCLLIFALTAVCLIALPMDAQAASESDLTFKLNDDGESYYVADCDESASGSLEIPATYNGKPVTRIGNDAFYNCSSLTSVTIGDSVTSIGSYAFYNCTSLTSVTIGDSVTSIGELAFNNCSSLVSINIPESTTNIEGNAFTNCDALTTVNFNAINCTDMMHSYWNYEIGGTVVQSVFADCSNLTTINIGAKVTSLPEYAFCGCSKLTSIIIPDAVTSIGDFAFSRCSSLTSITIPDGVTSIGNNAFAGCYNLLSATIGNGVTCINEYLFSGCNSLASIDLGNSVRSIGYMAFNECFSLTKVIIPDGAIKISTSAFQNCENLQEVIIPNSMISVDSGAFHGCSNLTYNIYDNAKYLGNDENPYMVLEKAVYWNITACSIHKDTKLICDYAFSRCERLTGIDIPDGVTSIGNVAFEDCSSLTSIVIPDSVTILGERVFRGCLNLEVASIGNGVTEIGAWAFDGCGKLSNIIIGNSVTAIKDQAFAYCRSLAGITIPESVTEIGYRAFADCDSLTSIIIPDSVTKIGKNAFSGCSRLESMTIPFVGESRKDSTETYQYPLGYIFGDESYTGGVATTQYFYGYSLNHTSFFTYYIPSSLKTVKVVSGEILYGAFYNCSDISCIILGNGVSGIGEDVFNSCSGLTDVYYVGEQEQWEKVTIGAGNAELTSAALHFGEPENVAKYVVSFLDWDGRVLNTNTYYNGDKVALPTNPTRAEDDTYTYTFVGWDKAIVNCVENAVYTAIYYPTYKEYTVTFKDCYGTILSVATYHYGDKVTAPANPTRADDSMYTYTFSGWDKPIVNCTGDATYTAAYKITVKEQPKPVVEGTNRVFGGDRYVTSYKVADTLKTVLGVEKFQNVIVASGTGFADALAGSYLASVKDAPILLVRASNVSILKDYIKNNLEAGGTVYLLGGVNAVPKAMETGLERFNVKRLGGATRYDTNLLILKEAGVAGKDIIVCTGKNFADSLSASATGLPILLVKDSLTASQKELLAATSGKKIVVGGTAAVNTRIENALKAYGTVKRLAGNTRYDTSVLVAKEFFESPKTAVLAYAQNFPDGLSGGALAYALNAPLILTDSNKPTAAVNYGKSLGIKNGHVLGGAGLISDKVVKNIFSMAATDNIIIK